MEKTFYIIFILFCYVSFKFLKKFSSDPEKELVNSLSSLSAVECPAGINLYRLKVGDSLFLIQVQHKLPHDILAKANILRKCERQVDSTERNIQTDRTELGRDKTDEFTEYYITDNIDISNLLEETCEDSRKDSDNVQMVYTEETHSLISNPFLVYMLHIVKGPEKVSLSDLKYDTEAWSYHTLVSGIFPGTLWCGFGNMAEDVYGQIGEHSETDNCCRSHDLCKPIIKAFETRYFYSNPSVLPISHCGCDAQFYKCLQSVGSPISKAIGNIFFNLVKMKCFDFDIREVCVASFFGLCVDKKERCVAVLKSNKLFPT